MILLKRILFYIFTSVIINISYFIAVFFLIMILFSIIENFLDIKKSPYFMEIIPLFMVIIISLYILYKNLFKYIINILIIGMLPMLILWVFIEKFTNKYNYLSLEAITYIIPVILIINTILLFLLTLLLYLSILAISLIPKYKKKYKERLIPYCKLAIYSTFFVGIFAYLIHIYN